MKKVFSYSLLVLFLAMSLQQVTTLGVYFLNQDFIAETFCINKDKPELQCKGKCHMKDMMAQNEENKEETIASEMIFAFYFEEFQQEIPYVKKVETKNNDFNKVLFASYESKMFQPPQA